MLCALAGCYPPPHVVQGHGEGQALCAVVLQEGAGLQQVRDPPGVLLLPGEPLLQAQGFGCEGKPGLFLEEPRGVFSSRTEIWLHK